MVSYNNYLTLQKKIELQLPQKQNWKYIQKKYQISTDHQHKITNKKIQFVCEWKIEIKKKSLKKKQKKYIITNKLNHTAHEKTQS